MLLQGAYVSIFCFSDKATRRFWTLSLLEAVRKEKTVVSTLLTFFGWRKWPTCCFYFVSCSLCVLYPHVLYFQNYILQLGRPSYLNFKKQHLSSIPSTKNLKRVQLGKVYTTLKILTFRFVVPPQRFRSRYTPPPKPTKNSETPKNWWVLGRCFSFFPYTGYIFTSPAVLDLRRWPLIDALSCKNIFAPKRYGWAWLGGENDGRSWRIFFEDPPFLYGMDGWIDRYIPSYNYRFPYPPYNRGSWNLSHFGEGSKLMQLLLTDFEGMIPQCILWVHRSTLYNWINRQKMVVERRLSFWGFGLFFRS